MNDTTLPPAQQKPPRLLSLDALRGFDMLWIVGAQVIVARLSQIFADTKWLQTCATQLTHVRWEGLRAYDLIFPLFIFLSGIAIPFSLGSRLSAGVSKPRLFKKIALRVGLLIFLGMVYNGVFSDSVKVPRFASVLGQIGIAWGIAATAFLLAEKSRARVGIVCLILGIVAVLQLVVPVPGCGTGILTSTHAFNTWLDRLLLPGTLNGKTFDPEGIMCCFSAGAVALSGTILGDFLKKSTTYSWRLVGWQTLAGLCFVGAGFLCWALGYQPIKSLWTSSFVLLATGISLLLFAVFFAIIDVLRFQRWSFPFRVIGLNALTIYFLVEFVNFEQIAKFLFGSLANNLGDAKWLAIAIGAVILEWLILYLFYRKKIFLRV